MPIQGLPRIHGNNLYEFCNSLNLKLFKNKNNIRGFAGGARSDLASHRQQGYSFS